MPTSNISYPEKKMLYKICDFLIEKKLTPEGKGIRRPLTIKLQEFSSVFNLNEDTNFEIEELKKELERLGEVIRKNEFPPLEIKNKKNLKDFSDNFRQNKSIVLLYERLEIEKYVQKLREGDKRRKEGADYNKLIFENLEGKCRFKYKGKEMTVKQREGTGSIGLNICLLMFKCPIIYSSEGTGKKETIYSEKENYKIGDKIQSSALLEIILIRTGNDSAIPSNDRTRPIRDSVRNINKSAQKKFGIDILNHTGQEVFVINKKQVKVM